MRCRNEHSKRFPTPKVKIPQEKEEKKEMKYSLAFHAEGKKGTERNESVARPGIVLMVPTRG